MQREPAQCQKRAARRRESPDRSGYRATRARPSKLLLHSVSLFRLRAHAFAREGAVPTLRGSALTRREAFEFASECRLFTSAVPRQAHALCTLR